MEREGKLGMGSFRFCIAAGSSSATRRKPTEVHSLRVTMDIISVYPRPFSIPSTTLQYDLRAPFIILTCRTGQKDLICLKFAERSLPSGAVSAGLDSGLILSVVWEGNGRGTSEGSRVFLNIMGEDDGLR